MDRERGRERSEERTKRQLTAVLTQKRSSSSGGKQQQQRHLSQSASVDGGKLMTLERLDATVVDGERTW
jgi:hypothetical protein